MNKFKSTKIIIVVAVALIIVASVAVALGVLFGDRKPNLKPIQQSLDSSASKHREYTKASLDMSVRIMSREANLDESYQKILTAANDIVAEQAKRTELVESTKDAELIAKNKEYEANVKQLFGSYESISGYAQKQVYWSKIEQAGCNDEMARMYISAFFIEDAQKYVDLVQNCGELLNQIKSSGKPLGILSDFVSWGGPFYDDSIEKYRQMVATNSLDRDYIKTATSELRSNFDQSGKAYTDSRDTEESYIVKLSLMTLDYQTYVTGRINQ